MTILHLRDRAKHPEIVVSTHAFDPIGYYQRALKRQGDREIGLRQALADMGAVLCQRDELLRQQDVLGREADHRLMNGLQMIVSLLHLQSRTSGSAEAAAQLSAAADRIAMIERVHRRLHSFEGAETIAFRKYVKDLCNDFAVMLSPPGAPAKVIAVEGAELLVPAAIGVPLGFVVSELITNAAKHGKGNISVWLESGSGNARALSVCNDGSVLPDGFDPAACTGLGMTIIRSFVAKIGGELRFGRAHDDAGTRFTVSFS